ncbi:MAG: 2-amino-4-hydroxy-6-hydroxymethyldihydropteridine diphosphokinase, partial [Lentisphaeria bacterium]|nr:2-amino-4-hydroxy-6-hydroxymethyldihydropteridine diphosphokinase [Lentisphaeria bacterium]
FVRLALDELKKGNFIIQQVSPLYETDPVDCEDGVPPFLNGVLQGVWNGSAEELLNLCQSIERRAGRPEKHSSRQSRELDLDIILFGQEIIRTERLTVPHPRAFQRAFVLAPMNDIAPDAVFPDRGKTVSALLGELPAPGGIRPYSAKL